MYRIRSASGTESVYNSLDEFTAAVQRGEVAAEDEIFHSRANRWLDVKSHPHYRGASSWSSPPGGFPSPASPAPDARLKAPAATTSAPVQTPPARPAVGPTNQPPATRPQLGGERPSVADLTAAPPVKPRKSKELTFIDVQGSAATAPPSEARTAPPPRDSKPVAVATPPQPGPVVPSSPPPPPTASEDAANRDFLVLDSGFDSPVRTSSGHKAVPENIEAQFDPPNSDKPPAPGAPAVQVTAEAPVPIKPAAPAKPLTPSPSKTPTPKPTSTVKLEPPPASTTAFSDLIEPEAERPAASIRGDGSVVDLERPVREPRHTSHRSLVTVASAPPAPRRKSAVLVLGSAAALTLGGAALGWWALSHRSTTGTPATITQPSGDTVPVTALRPVTADTVTIPRPQPAANPVDSAAAHPPRDEVIAAARPNFKADVVLPPSDLGLARVIGAGTAIPTAELVRRLSGAERQAAADLNARLSGFRNLFIPARLGNLEGVSQARSQWLSGAEAIRDYRARIARLETAYEDTALASQRVNRWSGTDMRTWTAKPTLAEPVAMSQLADLMFSQVNEALEILAALDGQYSVTGKSIGFRNPASGTRYLSIRNWVDQRTQAWSTTPETARPRTISAILVALGDGLPAVR